MRFKAELESVSRGRLGAGRGFGLAWFAGLVQLLAGAEPTLATFLHSTYHLLTTYLFSSDLPSSLASTGYPPT